MNDVKKMTSEELQEEIIKKSTEVINELGNGEVLSKEQIKKKRGPLKKELKGIKRLMREQSKKMKATKGGRK